MNCVQIKVCGFLIDFQPSLGIFFGYPFPVISSNAGNLQLTNSTSKLTMIHKLRSRSIRRAFIASDQLLSFNERRHIPVNRAIVMQNNDYNSNNTKNKLCVYDWQNSDQYVLKESYLSFQKAPVKIIYSSLENFENSPLLTYSKQQLRFRLFSLLALKLHSLLAFSCGLWT